MTKTKFLCVKLSMSHSTHWCFYTCFCADVFSCCKCWLCCHKVDPSAVQIEWWACALDLPSCRTREIFQVLCCVCAGTGQSLQTASQTFDCTLLLRPSASAYWSHFYMHFNNKRI